MGGGRERHKRKGVEGAQGRRGTTFMGAEDFNGARGTVPIICDGTLRRKVGI